MSTVSQEVVTCRTADGKVLHLFGKSGPAGSTTLTGHACGLAYEAEI